MALLNMKFLNSPGTINALYLKKKKKKKGSDKVALVLRPVSAEMTTEGYDTTADENLFGINYKLLASQV